jgi:hypothetical protein
VLYIIEETLFSNLIEHVEVLVDFVLSIIYFPDWYIARYTNIEVVLSCVLSHKLWLMDVTKQISIPEFHQENLSKKTS